MDIFEKLGDGIMQFLSGVLPTSPFRPTINALGELPWLGYLNWFIPVGTFVKIGTIWLGAVTLYYVYSILLRWANAIE